MTALIISDKVDIMEKVHCLKESNSLVDDVSKINKKEAKERNIDFLASC